MSDLERSNGKTKFLKTSTLNDFALKFQIAPGPFWDRPRVLRCLSLGLCWVTP